MLEHVGNGAPYVVDDDVEAAECLLRSGCETGDVVEIGQISRYDQHHGVAASIWAATSSNCVAVRDEHDHVSPRLGQSDGAGCTDPPTRAGHDRDSVGQQESLEDHRFPSSPGHISAPAQRPSSRELNQHTHAMTSTQDETRAGQMRAVVHDRYGPPDVLHVELVARPSPGPDQLLVEVHACTVNRTDCGFRARSRSSSGSSAASSDRGSGFSGLSSPGSSRRSVTR